MTSTSPSEGASPWPYAAEPSVETRLGISLSGGGIRSATFSLGVYQRLSEEHIFERARFLSAVSGGSYLAAGLAISHAECPPHLRDAQPPPWARGSPEEARLRRHLSYLAPGGRGRLWLFANILYGLILNLTPLVLGAFVAGRLAGVVLRALYPGLGERHDVDLTAVPWIVASIVGLVLASAAVVGLRRFRDQRRADPQWVPGSRSERTVMVLLSSAAILTAATLVLPIAVHVLARSTSSDVAAWLGLADAPRVAQRVVLGLVAVGIALGLGGFAVWLLQRRKLQILRGLIAALSGASILFVPFILAVETATVWQRSLLEEALALAGAGAVIVAFAVFAHNRRYSMHLFYRERIQGAFALRRVEPTNRDSETPYEARPVPYAETIFLTDVTKGNAERSSGPGPRFPELIVCAAVAARGSQVPSKTRAASFTFEGAESGNARLRLNAPTEQIEEGDWIGGGRLTLPSMMAISGAAVSPLMGRFTLPAFRFLMAMLNIRLGVWIRNPGADRDAAHADTRNPIRNAWRYAVRGWREPGAWYVLKEGLGLADLRGRFIYVSDGGHWENLGLTELLRRRCTHVIVVDASGDPGLGDIGRAMAVSRAELGVEFRLDPRTTLPDAVNRAATPVAVGSFRYPDGQEGDLYYARSVLWPGAPTDLELFASREQLFPNHPTSNQFLSGELFDAYRALGWAVGDELVKVAMLPPKEADEQPCDRAGDDGDAGVGDGRARGARQGAAPLRTIT